jgi:hypothetical protein
LLYTKLHISFVYFCHSRVQFHILFSHLILGRENRCSYNISLSENVITYTSLCSPCFLVYLMAISQLHRLYSLKWKKSVVAYFKVLFQHLPRELKKSTETLSQKSWSTI